MNYYPIDSVRRFVISRSSSFWLVLCAGLMTVVFWGAFGERYNLAEHGHKAFQSFATLNRMSAEGAFLYIAGFGALFGAYWFGYHFGVRRLVMKGRSSSRLAWVVAIGGTAMFNAALMPMLPADAADIYDYIIRGRMSAFYGLNPLKDTPNQIPEDPFLRYAAWDDVPSAYGPAWEILAAVAAYLAGNDNTHNVIVFKLLAVAGYALTALLVALTLKQLAPRRIIVGFYLFAWNPLVVFMCSGTGHNDSWMAAAMLLGLYLLSHERYRGAILAAILGTAIKFIGILLIPLIVIMAFRRLKRPQWAAFMISSCLASAILAVVLYAPFWIGWETLRTERRAAMYTGSAATIIRQVLAPILDGKGGDSWVIDTPVTNTLLANLTLGIFALIYLGQAFLVFRKPTLEQIVRSITWILLGYLLIASLWFQAWYVIWVLPLAALLDDGFLRRFTLWFSYLVTWQPFLYNWVTLRPGQRAPLPWRDLVPVAVHIGGTWFTALWYPIRWWLAAGVCTPYTLRIGKRLTDLRQKVGLTPSEASDQAGIPTDVLLRLEHGIPPIPLQWVASLEALYGEENDLMNDFLR